MIEFIVWQVRLWLVDARWRAKDRRFSLGQQRYNAFIDRKRVQAFLDRVSPWIANTGYDRTWIRRVAFYVTVPRLALVYSFWRVTFNVLDRLAPYVGPGRFELFYQPRDALKAEWLYDHSEYATDEFGDVETAYQYNWFFEESAVPWSRDPETWIMSITAQGFVTASYFEILGDAQVLFERERDAFDRLTAEPDDDDLPEGWRIDDDGWREGQPEFNGAFR